MKTEHYGDRYETVVDANETSLIENVAKAVIGIGCSNVIANIVKYTMPYHAGFWTKNITKLGGAMIGFAVGDIVADYSIERGKELKKEYDRVMEEGGFV